MYATDEGLGDPIISAVSSVIGGIFGGNPKDANRMATNTRAYNQAVSGSDGPFEGASSGLEFLRIHSVMNDPDGGWATQVATTDASKKYAAALKALHPAAVVVPGTTKVAPVISGAPPVVPISPVGSGTVNLPLVGAVATTPLLIAGVAAAAILILNRSGRR